jgi:enoyl-CoA hydratase/carnithine racemase
MAKFEEYCDKYKHLKMQRSEGILEVSLHSDGGPVVWGPGPHRECGAAFGDIAADPGNRVVIFTGAGSEFIAREQIGHPGVTAPVWERVFVHGQRLIYNHLEIRVPMIAAINGPATIHAELGLLCDIVLAADDTVFQDAPHYPEGLVPGDGVHVLWPLLLGMNRGRYFLLTGEKISAKQALDLGVVSEVMPRDQLMERAREHARKLLKQPPMTVTYARLAITHELKRLMRDHLDYGFLLEGLAATEYFPGKEAHKPS